jgi:hypothetical protein
MLKIILSDQKKSTLWIPQSSIPINCNCYLNFYYQIYFANIYILYIYGHCGGIYS